GEHLTGARGVEHAHPDEPAVHRLVSRAAPRYQGDLALDGCVRADDVVGVDMDLDQIAVRPRDPAQFLADHVLRIVDQLLHQWVAPFLSATPSALPHARATAGATARATDGDRRAIWPRARPRCRPGPARRRGSMSRPSP